MATRKTQRCIAFTAHQHVDGLRCASSASNIYQIKILDHKMPMEKHLTLIIDCQKGIRFQVRRDECG